MILYLVVPASIIDQDCIDVSLQTSIGSVLRSTDTPQRAILKFEDSVPAGLLGFAHSPPLENGEGLYTHEEILPMMERTHGDEGPLPTWIPSGV